MPLTVRKVVFGVSVVVAAIAAGLSGLFTPRSFNAVQKTLNNEQQNGITTSYFPEGEANIGPDYLYTIEDLAKAAALGDVQALAELTERATLGGNNAQYFLGSLYNAGKSVNRDLTAAVYWWQKAAEQGNMMACYDLGVAYRDGHGGLIKDFKRAAELFETAANKGLYLAQYNLATLYKTGQGVAKNPVKAAEWYKAAADQDDAESQYELAKFHFFGRGGLSENPDEAKALFKKAAEQNHAEAQYALGEICAKGIGVRNVGRNFTKAIYWWGRAAMLENADAQYALARYYGGTYPGARDIPPNPQEALKWLKKAAAQEHKDAQNALGEFYYHKSDREEALKWWGKAAKNGHFLAKEHLKFAEEQQMIKGVSAQSALFEQQGIKPSKKNDTNSFFSKGEVSTVSAKEGGYVPTF